MIRLRLIKTTLIVLIFVSCNHEVKSKHLKQFVFPSNINEITINKKTLSIVCYFKGECSFCYGNIMNIEKEFPNMPLICITNEVDTILIDNYMRQINFKGTLLLDSLSEIYNINKHILERNKLLLLDSNKKIIDSSEFELTNEVNKRFKNKIKMHVDQ